MSLTFEEILTNDLYELVRELRDRKMSETSFRRKTKAMLEARTDNPPAENSKIIKGLMKIAKRDRKLYDELYSRKRY